jgi:protoporphyrinogen oxidase
MEIGIIGAGPAGMTAAYLLTQKGHKVAVFEAGQHVGGLARTISLWGQRVDLGPHRFLSKDSRVNQLWEEVAAGDLRVVQRMTRIFYSNRFYDYPLRPVNALQNMGLPTALSCLASYARQKWVERAREEKPESFEEWVVAAFGRKLFEMFFKSYSEKLWGISCEELDADFAAQRIKKFSLGGALLSALGLDRQKHRTLAHEFKYPTGGTGMIYDRMAEKVLASGGEVHLSTPVAGLTTDTRGLRFQDGSSRHFDHIISTMPLTLMCRSLPDLPSAVSEALGQLTYRNTILVYLRVDADSLFPDQWLYVQSPELKLGRITNFRNWVPELHGESRETILALEYWCDDADDVWKWDDVGLIEMAKAELAETRLLQGATVLEGSVIKLPRCYPVYRKGYRQSLKPIIDHLRTQVPTVSAIGRYGAFKYNNQDHSILMGILAAENIADGAGHDLWSINSDYEVYQEEA